MRNKKLMVDYDCTLVDFLTPYLGWCKSHLDIDAKKFDMTEYDWPRKFIGDGCSAFWNSDIYFDKVRPFTGAKEFIDALWQEDIEFAICTIAEEKFHLQKRNMIYEQLGFFGIEIINLPVTTQKRHSLEAGDDYLFMDDRKSYIDPQLDILYNHHTMHPWANNNHGEHYNVLTSYEDVLKHILS